jgi:hypothetical protein
VSAALALVLSPLLRPISQVPLMSFVFASC